MNKLKDEWVAALLSGDFKQGQGRLCRLRDGQPEYCCLGVLAEVMKIPYTESENCRVYDYGMTCLLRIEQLEQVGLTREGGFSLADMNDRGASFEEIARRIENGLR